MSDEWIDWRGGTCPVSPDTRVDVRWANGAISRNMAADTWSPKEHMPSDLWSQEAGRSRIVGYRLAQVEQVQP